MVSRPTFSACPSARREPLAGGQSAQGSRCAAPYWLDNQASTGSHRTLARPGWADYVFAFHDADEIGPKILARFQAYRASTRGRLSPVRHLPNKRVKRSAPFFCGGRLFATRKAFLRVAFMTVGFSTCGPPSVPRLENPDDAPSAVAALAGCWRFSLRSTREPHMPPGLIVRFHTTPADTFNLYMLRLAVDTPLSARDRFGRWGLIEGSNQVFASWGDGFTGLELRLALQADTLRGRASRTTDTPAPPSGFAVTAARTPCPAGV
jgi:hypothetical protein